jgi:hypothetical protein
LGQWQSQPVIFPSWRYHWLRWHTAKISLPFRVVTTAERTWTVSKALLWIGSAGRLVGIPTMVHPKSKVHTKLSEEPPCKQHPLGFSALMFWYGLIMFYLGEPNANFGAHGKWLKLQPHSSSQFLMDIEESASNIRWVSHIPLTVKCAYKPWNRLVYSSTSQRNPNGKRIGSHDFWTAAAIGSGGGIPS